MTTLGYESRTDPAPRPPRRWTFVAAVVCAAILALFTFAAISGLTRPTNLQRVGADQAKCAANLARIDRALRQYASTSGGRFPDSLATLVDTGALPASALTCPLDDAPRATMPTGSYDFVAAGCDPALLKPRQIVLIEASDCSGDYAAHALLGDGTVVRLEPTRRSFKTLPWWENMQAQIARGDRPILLPLNYAAMPASPPRAAN